MGESEDFPWVQKRAECSYSQVFKELEMAVDSDVKIKHKQTEGGPRGFRFQRYSDDRFVVYREAFQGSTNVEFGCTHPGIYAKGEGVNLKAVLSLNDDGECRLKVGDDELKNWQFRKRALEDLFFGF